MTRYKGVPPSVDIVRKCVDDSGMSRRSFELVYGIVEKSIQRYYKGQRSLPVCYWHIFYEFNNLDNFYTNFTKKKKREKKKVEVQQPKPVPVISESNKSIIDAFRKRLS